MTTNFESSSILALVFNLIVNLFVVTFLISLIGDLAEAILTCRLVDKYIEKINVHAEKDGEEIKY